MNILSLGVITAYVVVLFYYIKDTEYTKMLGLTCYCFNYLST